LTKKIMKELEKQMQMIHKLTNLSDFQRAILNSDKSIFENFKYQSQVNDTDKLQCTPLHYAVFNNDWDSVNKLVSFEANVNKKCLLGHTPLSIAAGKGYFDIFSILLMYWDGIQFDWDFIYFAIDQDQLHIVKYFIEYVYRMNYKIEASDIKRNYYDMLIRAVERKNLPMVSLFLKEIGSLKKQYFKNDTPLHAASKIGNLQILELLLAKHSNVDAQNNKGIAPLHLASENGHLNVVKTLVEHQAYIDLINFEGRTPLSFSITCGHLDVAHFLLDNGASMTRKDHNLRGPLHLASQFGHADIVQRLVQNKDIDLDEITNELYSPLHLAIWQGHLEVVQCLFDAGSQIFNENTSAINLAAQFNQLEIMKFLIQSNVSPSLIHSGNAPIHVAVFYNNLSIVEFLISQDVSIDEKNQGGYTPMHIAAYCNNLTMLNRLIELHGSINELTFDEKFSPLHLASLKGHVSIVNRLLECKASLFTNESSTPLHAAASMGHLDVIKRFAQKNYPLDSPCENNFTPLHVSLLHNHTHVALYLLSLNVSILPTSTKEGFSVLHMVVMYLS